MSSKLKNIFSIFSLKKKSVPREEPLPSSILSYILICFDYINKFNSNQVQRLYAIPKNKLPVHTPHKESYDLMDTMLNDTFNESIMKRLFDPFIIIEAIQLVLKKFEPIITYPLIKELVIQRNKNYSIILKNLSTEHSNFLKYLMLHIEILLKNGTAERLDLMTIFSELVLDPHPNDCNHGDESKVALEVFIEIYDNWREILEVADEIIDGGTIDHIPDVTVTEYSIQDRTVKISFPKGEYEENMITKNQLTKILSNFGEISEVYIALLIIFFNLE